MNIQYINSGIKFSASIRHRVCVIEGECRSKTFFLKNLLSAEFNGYRYSYYDWRTYKTLNWFSGELYDKYKVIALDDADLYTNSLLRVIQATKATILVVADKANASAIIRNFPKAKTYCITCDNAQFMIKPKPSRCAYCGKEFGASQLTVEHIIPRNFCDTYIPGATIRDHYFNKCLVCFDCNRAKSDDIWIPNYRSDRWMRHMTEEQIGGYSDIFVQLLNAQYDNVVWWIYLKNMQSHVRYRIDFKDVKPIIEEELKFFLNRYIDRKPGNYWVLI